MKTPNPGFKYPVIPIELLLNTEALNSAPCGLHPDMMVLQDWLTQSLKRPPNLSAPLAPIRGMPISDRNLRRWLAWHTCQAIQPTAITKRCLKTVNNWITDKRSDIAQIPTCTNPVNNPSQHMFLVHLFIGSAYGYLSNFHLASSLTGTDLYPCYQKLCLVQKYLPPTPPLSG